MELSNIRPEVVSISKTDEAMLTRLYQEERFAEFNERVFVEISKSGGEDYSLFPVDQAFGILKNKLNHFGEENFDPEQLKEYINKIHSQIKECGSGGANQG